MIRLETRRLVVRDPSPADMDGWHRLFSNRENMRFTPDLLAHSPEESARRLETAITEAGHSGRTRFFFTVELRETRAFAGSVGYSVTGTTPLGHLATAGYFFLPSMRGRGYATEAFSEVIRHVFADSSVFRLTTGCLAENVASERVMQKCGMAREAYRPSAVWHEGRMKDRVEYCLLRPGTGQPSEPPSGPFWSLLEKLVASSAVVMDRPRGTAHPRYPNFIYPLDYGHLENTASMDGTGIDVWRGSMPGAPLTALICTVDLAKRDSEIKLLLGCTGGEAELALRVHNETETMKGLLVRR